MTLTKILIFLSWKLYDLCSKYRLETHKSNRFERNKKSLDEVMMNADPNCSVHWFEIDEKFHGSVATFPSKEVYESMRLRRENHRKEANDRGVKMIYEVVGHLKAEAHS